MSLKVVVELKNFNCLDDMSKRIDETNIRINTITLGFLGLLGILSTGLLTALGKLVFFPNV